MTVKPAANQPGTLLEQLTAVDRFLDLPPAYRRSLRGVAWKAARESVMSHARRLDRDDLEHMLPPLVDEVEPQAPMPSDTRRPAIRRAHEHVIQRRLKERRRTTGRST